MQSNRHFVSLKMSMRSQWEGCQPRFGVAELVGAQSVWVDTFGNSQIVAEQLTDDGAWYGQK